jgi:hypothetical protein
MRNKILMITAMLAVMVAMIGIAAASGIMTLQAPPQVMNPGDVFEQDVEVVADRPQSNPNPTINKLEIFGRADPAGNDFNPTSVISIEISSDGGSTYTPGSLWTGAKNSPHTFKVRYSHNLAPPATGEYEFQYNGWDNKGVTTGTADMITNIYLNFIPEFPTVALPIAAVIGLVFFFQQRKNKKE